MIYLAINPSINLPIYQSIMSKKSASCMAGCWVNCGLPEPVWLRGRGEIRTEIRVFRLLDRLFPHVLRRTVPGKLT